MKALAKFLLPVVCTLALAGCGGGSGGSSGSAFEPPKDTVQVSVGSSSITTNSFTTLTVNVKKQDGTAEADGTSISASISPATIGSIGGATGSTAGTTATNTLSGGATSFTFNSAGNTGTATILISLPPINGNPSSVTATATITVTAGSTSDPRLKLTPTAVTLPLNPLGPDAENGADGFPTNYIGSPYIAEVAVEWRHTNGQLVTGTSKVNVSITPVTVAGFSQLDDGTTIWTGETKTPPTVDGNEFLTILGSGPVNVTGGIGTIFVHANNVPGTAVLTVTAIDPDNSQTISSQLTVTIQGAASNKFPGAVTISQTGSTVYISGANGAQSTLLSAVVTDGNGALIADPTDGQGNTWDNVQFDIVGPAGNDAKLTALNAKGQSQTGTTVVTNSHNGIASVSFQAGSQQGPVQVRVTVDRGDNNVDNGVLTPDAITATATVIVSDGKLYSLTLTSPDTNAILINRVSGSTSLSSQSGTSGVTIPPDPDATYSLTVTALGTDRQGNPVTPTTVKFGSIDTPQTPDFTGVCNGFGGMEICGFQGDPVEGGTQFSAVDGHFLTAAGTGAGPNDTLVVFGKEKHGAPAGNDDLESAVKISSVVSNTVLNVATAFNLNDTTGAPVNNHGVLPYVVGRATLGNISSPATTNSIGAASTTLNYPVSALDKTTVIWVQGTGTDTVTGGTKTITDAAVAGFPGVAPATIIISPSPIPGNITTAVQVCIVDALSSPLPGIVFNFAFSNLGVGSGTVDGVTGGSGSTAEATGSDGCVVTTVTTTGISTGGTGGGTTSTPSLSFTAGSATASANITASGSLILLASPSALGGTGGNVTLTLLNSNGTPVPGVQLTGTCTGAGVGLASGPGTTSSTGKTSVSITANLNSYGSAGTGTCTFTTGTGSPTVTVNLQGTDLCKADPNNAACSGGTSGGGGALSITADATAAHTAGNYIVSVSYGTTSPATTFNCSAPAGSSNTCSVTTSGTVSAAAVPTAGFTGWSGNCSGTTSPTAVNTSGTSPTCKGTWAN
jgi:hypothetical protein